MEKPAWHKKISCRGFNDKETEDFLANLFQKKIVRVKPPREYRHCFDIADEPPSSRDTCTTLVTEEFSAFTFEFEGGIVLRIGTYREELKLDLTVKRQPVLL